MALLCAAFLVWYTGIMKLSPKQDEVYRRRLEGQTQGRIAMEMGISPIRVRQLIREARIQELEDRVRELEALLAARQTESLPGDNGT